MSRIHHTLLCLAPIVGLASAIGGADAQESLPKGISATAGGGYTSDIDGAKLLQIPGGQYVLGNDSGRYDERPAVKIELDAFLIDEREVTNAQFEKFVAASGYEPVGPWRRGYHSGAAAVPVRFVTWADASAYAKWAGRRLPTEAEWEVAVGPATYPWGEEWDAAAAIVGGGPGPVASGQGKDKSPFGVHDLAGNLREWTSAWYDRYAYQAYEGARNPTGPADGTPPDPKFVQSGADAGNERSTRKVVRGGSWISKQTSNIVKHRRWAHSPAHWFDDIGFRCALGLGGER